MDPEGITRAWPIAPLISRKTSPTQNQAIISRRTFCSTVRFSLGFCVSTATLSAFTVHQSPWPDSQPEVADRGCSLTLQRNDVGRNQSCCKPIVQEIDLQQIDACNQSLEYTKQPAPANFARMQSRVQISERAFHDLPRVPRAGRRIDRHIDHDRRSDNIFARNAADVTTIE